MSHFVDLKTAMTDAESIKKALLHMGFNESDIKIHSKNVKIKNYFEEETGQKASIVVHRDAVKRVTGCLSNDVGFYQKADGTYGCHMDDGVVGQHPDFMSKLGTYYNYEKSKIELEARKIRYEEKVDANGRLQLHCTFKKKNKGISISL